MTGRLKTCRAAICAATLAAALFAIAPPLAAQAITGTIVDTAPPSQAPGTEPALSNVPPTLEAPPSPVEAFAPSPSAGEVLTAPPSPDAAAAADELAGIFSELGDQIYEDCIFDLSDEQIEVQAALIQSYVAQGADSAAARKLAAIQIQPPKLSAKCEQMRKMPRPTETLAPEWTVTTAPTPEPAPKKPVIASARPGTPDKSAPSAADGLSTVIALDGVTTPTQWDCAPDVDFVTIKLNGFQRKLTGGEICNPFEDVVREVPSSATPFRLGYTIRNGRLFVISDDPSVDGQTIAWGLSGRDICRNNPDPDCFATRAVGPLPPGEYAFASNKGQRVTWGPKTKRHVAAVYLKKLWNTDRFSKAHKAAILKRGNIAIHARLKGEMSEACIGLEPKGWAYVASLIREGRATSLNVYIDEPHPQIAGTPPVIVASSFSLTSLFK